MLAKHAANQANAGGLILGQMAGTSQALQPIKQMLVAPSWGKWQVLAKLFYLGYNQMMMNQSLGEAATPNAVLTGKNGRKHNLP